MYAILIVDFATIEKAIGPFGTRADAVRWAEANAMGEIYRVVELHPSTEVNVIVRKLLDN